MDPLKRQKLLKRTRMGLGLACGVVGLLWVVNLSASPLPILGIGLCLALLCLLEIARMGRLAGRGLLLVLLPAWLVWALLALRGLLDERTAAAATEIQLEALRGQLYQRSSSFELSLLVGVALWSQLSLRLFGSPAPWRRLLGLLLLAGLTLALLRVAQQCLALSGQDRSELVAWSEHGVFMLPALALVLLSLTALAARLESARRWLTSAVLVLWLVPALPSLALVFQRWGVWGLWSLLLLSKIGDTAGYYAGNAWGKHHPFPAISPGKTSEGCLASLLAGTLCGALAVGVGWLPQGAWGLWGGLLAGAAVNLAAQAGDLFESFVKRRAGVKDSGTWFGPSGGVLDLVDSLLFSVPVALLTWPLILAV